MFMVNYIQGIIALLIPNRISRRTHGPCDSTDFLNLPHLENTPVYSVEELLERSDLAAAFNRADFVRAAWNEEIGRLEYTAEDGTRFWFAASSDHCRHLADLASFQGAKFRAALQHDGRVALTGWYENWYYSTMTDSVTLAK